MNRQRKGRGGWAGLIGFVFLPSVFGPSVLVSQVFAAEPLGTLGDRLDDPKIVRRFGGAGDAEGGSDAPSAAAGANASVDGKVGASGGSDGAGAVDAAVKTESRPVSPPWPFSPRVELTWRYLPLFRLGAQQNGDASGGVANEGFQVLSGRFFPWSSLFRLGLSTDFGWESGHFATGGDYFLSESTSFGLQRRDRVTPFVEAVAGGGFMRRLEVGVSVPMALWFFGAEGGVDIYAVDRLYVHLSLGRMRVVNGFAQKSGVTRVFEDVWAFRVGVGL